MDEGRVLFLLTAGKGADTERGAGPGVVVEAGGAPHGTDRQDGDRDGAAWGRLGTRADPGQLQVWTQDTDATLKHPLCEDLGSYPIGAVLESPAKPTPQAAA